MGSSKDVYVNYQSGSTHYRLDLHFFMRVYNRKRGGCS